MPHYTSNLQGRDGPAKPTSRFVIQSGRITIQTHVENACRVVPHDETEPLERRLLLSPIPHQRQALAPIAAVPVTRVTRGRSVESIESAYLSRKGKRHHKLSFFHTKTNRMVVVSWPAYVSNRPTYIQHQWAFVCKLGIPTVVGGFGKQGGRIQSLVCFASGSHHPDVVIMTMTAPSPAHQPSRPLLAVPLY